MLKEYLEAAKGILLPSLCFSCERKITHGYICTQCQDKIEFLYPPLCRFCSKPVNENKTGLCKNCLGKTFAYERLVCITAYSEPMATLIHLFKYKNYEYIVEFFSSLMIAHLLKIGFNFQPYDFITSVPIHISKLRERGYNQSSLLAKYLANYFQIPFKDDIISNTAERISQTKLEKEKREKNIKGAFIVKNNQEGKKIILMDDIFTTGSTVKECAHVLKEKKAQLVTVITLSKTQ